jgi:hypothetical protein
MEMNVLLERMIFRIFVKNKPKLKNKHMNYLKYFMGFVALGLVLTCQPAVSREANDTTRQTTGQVEKEKEKGPAWYQHFFLQSDFRLSSSYFQSDYDIALGAGYNFYDRAFISMAPVYYHKGAVLFEEKANVFGGKVFGKVFVYKNISVLAESEIMFVKDSLVDNDQAADEMVQSWNHAAGISYDLPLGDRLALGLKFLFYFKKGVIAPYKSTPVRFSFSYYFAENRLFD